jgi:hypothetical protein
MRFIKAFFVFWYDFIVGDDWRVALGVVSSLAVCAVLAATEAIETEAIAIIFFVGVLASLLVSLRTEAMKARRG